MKVGGSNVDVVNGFCSQVVRVRVTHSRKRALPIPGVLNQIATCIEILTA